MHKQLIDYKNINLFSQNTFFTDYIQGKKNSLYSSDFSIESISSINSSGHLSKELIDDIRNYNTSLLPDETTDIALNLLLKEDTSVIITGQQPHIGGGPMYTLYKIITSIMLAEKLKEKNGREYAAVFWNGSDDHDIDEVNKLEFPAIDYGLYKTRFNLEYSGYPIYGYNTQEHFKSLAEEALSNLRESEFTPLVKELLSAKTNNLGEHVSYIYKKLLYGKSLVVLEPKILRKYSSDIYSNLVENEGDINKSVEELGAKNSEFITKYGSSNLYYHGNKIREKIVIENAKYLFSGKCLDKQSFKSFVSKNPKDFSPGVVFRPVVQDYFFPTVCYVGGPSECSYFSQLKDAYRLTGVGMPAIMPRLSATIIKTSENKIIEKYGFNILDVINSHISLPEDSDEEKAKSEIESFVESIHAQLDDFRKTAEARSNELLEHLNPSFRKIETELIKAGEKYLKTCRKIKGIKGGHIERLHFEITPNKSLQERIFSPLFYINLYGTDFIEKIIENAEIDVFKHHIFYF
jgi:bacillithiol biosynthesis cysteine-adding enzyme BshC